MIQKYNRYKIMGVFFDYPAKGFHLRELVRLTMITMPSMISHIKELVKEELIIKEEKGIYPTYKANIESKKYNIYKVQNLVLRMNDSGLLDYIYDLCVPNAIILFGSASRGEDSEKSDIDLFVQSKEKKTDLGKYEKIFKRKINLYFESNFNKLPNELKNNILNGQIVRGYLKVF
ncbi:MAG: nucleotidyltransferase domain-containing protein [Nanoarchaeota archaeon]